MNTTSLGKKNLRRAILKPGKSLCDDLMEDCSKENRKCKGPVAILSTACLRNCKVSMLKAKDSRQGWQVRSLEKQWADVEGPHRPWLGVWILLLRYFSHPLS